jgi:hypothetical protein
VRIFGLKRDEVTREWRTVHNEKYHDLYSSPNIVRMIKLKMMLWTGHVARLRERRGKPGGKRPLGDPGIDGRIILRWIFRKWGYGLDGAG